MHDGLTLFFILPLTGDACLAAQLVCLRALRNRAWDRGAQQGEESSTVISEALRRSNDEVQCPLGSTIILTVVQFVLFVTLLALCEMKLNVVSCAVEGDCLWHAV